MALARTKNERRAADAATLVADLAPLELTPAQFETIAGIVHQTTGINLRSGKEQLVKSRLAKRLRALGLDGFKEYLELVEGGGAGGREIDTMVDLLTTNKTSFFREPKHFEFLRQWLKANCDQKKIRIWSAGCSSGEEPFSIAITLCQGLPEIERRDVRVLATDISGRMLARAKQAVYERDGALGDVPPAVLARYFTCVPGSSPTAYTIGPEARSLVRFARLNLLGSWPMKGTFDLVFCRNVMIYFDAATRTRVVGGIWQVLKPGGYIFVGHSESLLGSSRGFKYIQPAVYIKDHTKC